LNENLRELWISRLADFRASNESVRIWCERHQIPKDQFYYWRNKLEKAEQPSLSANLPKWLSLSLGEPASVEPASDSAGPIQVQVCLARIEVRAGFDPALLSEVVKALKNLC
jgi:hypothetical protein